MDVNNLTDLMEIDKDNVTNILNERYNNNTIYTNIDDILISINPYKELDIYNYDNFTKPHIFDISQKSLSNLKKFNKNQTILISGDSGSGKTYNTRCIINYYAHYFSCNEKLCNQIINANPIIEVFGNAQTIMNDNSSRFGKFIKLYFNKNITEISGIQIDTYLLEKSRVCYQNNKDYNFHIFNQIAEYNNKKYQYCPKTVTYNKLEKTIQMMIDFGFDPEEVDDIIKICNLILEIGEYGKKETNFEKFTDLSDFKNQISTRVINAGKDKIIKKLEGEELEKHKFTMSTQIYEIIFHYIIDKINTILNPNHTNSHYIGLLDIFGFELFDNNNFEQLCINYTNEKLQNHHNFIIFENEQELYRNEGINWKIVDYKDNKEILQIFEQKYGIINLLDEECKLVKSSDDNFHLKMQNMIKSKYLDVKDYNKEFNIHHYAGNVKYTSINFCEKNKQKITKELKQYLSQSNNIIFSNISKKVNRSNSIIKSFSKELNNLMNKIKQTNSIFIKCIKPNYKQKPDYYDHKLVSTQLLFSGIYETIEISRENYPIRYPIVEFYNKYNCVMNEFNLKNFTLKDIQFGKTKVFMRTETFMCIEDLLFKYKNYCATVIQSCWRRYFHQKFYQLLRLNTIKIQSMIRMFIQKRKYQRIRNTIIKLQSYRKMIIARRDFIKLKKNIILIQSVFRMKIEKDRFNKKKKIVLKLQNYWRMYNKRKTFIELLKIKNQPSIRSEPIPIPTIPKKAPFWPKSSKNSPSIFFITNNDLIDDKTELLEEPTKDEEKEEIEIIKKQYEKKIKKIEQKTNIEKKKIKEKMKQKINEYETENELLSTSLNTSQETNKVLVERLNNLLIANFQLQQRYEDEKKKGAWKKLVEFLFN